MLKNKKALIIIGVSVAVVAVGSLVLATGNTGNVVVATGADTIIMSNVAQNDLVQVVTANGTVALERIEPVYSSAQGETRLRVDQVLVEVGDHVEIGQPIVIYDVYDAIIAINNRIRESEINIQNQRLTVQSQRLGPNPTAYNVLLDAIFTAQNGIRTAEEAIVTAQNNINVQRANIDTAHIQIEAARSALTTAQNNVETNQILLNAGAISQTTFNGFIIAEETAQNTLDERLNALVQNESNYEANQLTLETRERELETAIRNLANAERDYQIATNPLGSENTRIAHAQAQNTLQNLQNMHNNLLDERSRLIAETVSHTSGTVTEVPVTVGAQVIGTSRHISVANFDNLIVNAYIREVDAPLISVGQSVRMTNSGLIGQVYSGTVDFINPIATTRQAQTGTEVVVSVRIVVDNPDEQLRPGYSVDIEVVMQESLNAINVPLMSLVFDEETGGFAVFVVDSDNIIRKRAITTGISTPTNMEVLQGVSEGDIIILIPTPTMQDGDILPDGAVFGGGFDDAMGQGGSSGGVTFGGGSGNTVIITN